MCDSFIIFTEWDQSSDSSWLILEIIQIYGVIYTADY